LCEKSVLQYPDFSKPFILITNASGIAIGGILSQREINKDQPIAYASQTLTENEIKYTYEKEALAIVYCVKHFKSYLYGRKFTLLQTTNLFSGLKMHRIQTCEYYDEIKIS